MQLTRGLQEIIEDHRDWLPDSRFMAERRIAQLQAQLDERSYDGLTLATMSLSFLAEYYGARGVVAQADGTGEKEDIHRSLMHRFWDVRISVAASAKRAFLGSLAPQRNLTNHLSLAACLVFAFSATDARWEGRVMTEALKYLLHTDPKITGVLRKDRQVANFALWLGEKHFYPDANASPVDSSNPGFFGVYHDVVRRWGTSHVTDSIDDLLGYHYSNTVDDDDENEIPDFRWYPFDAIPFEVAAIVRLNALDGVHFSERHSEIARHAHIPDDASSFPTDGNLERVADLFNEYFS